MSKYAHSFATEDEHERFTADAREASNDELLSWIDDWCDVPLDEIDLLAVAELQKRIADGRITSLPDGVSMLLMEVTVNAA